MVLFTRCSIKLYVHVKLYEYTSTKVVSCLPTRVRTRRVPITLLRVQIRHNMAKCGITSVKNRDTCMPPPPSGRLRTCIRVFAPLYAVYNYYHCLTRIIILYGIKVHNNNTMYLYFILGTRSTKSFVVVSITIRHSYVGQVCRTFVSDWARVLPAFNHLVTRRLLRRILLKQSH